MALVAKHGVHRNVLAIWLNRSGGVGHKRVNETNTCSFHVSHMGEVVLQMCYGSTCNCDDNATTVCILVEQSSGLPLQQVLPNPSPSGEAIVNLHCQLLQSPGGGHRMVCVHTCSRVHRIPASGIVPHVPGRWPENHCPWDPYMYISRIVDPIFRTAKT